jgi:Dullard-like phosphatase family protein
VPNESFPHPSSLLGVFSRRKRFPFFGDKFVSWFWEMTSVQRADENRRTVSRNSMKMIAIEQPQQRGDPFGYRPLQGDRFRLPPQKPEHNGRLTVVLDIDETLVHTEMAGLFEPLVPDANTFFLNLGGLRLRVRKRPSLDDFLREASRQHELIAFTAGSEEYATAVLDFLDPKGSIFTHRLFRQHCLPISNVNFIKDLRIVNRCLRRTVLVDNNNHSFILQLRNGIPVESFFQNDKDNVLVLLYHYLVELATLQDVRPALDQRFCLDSVYNPPRAA